MKKSFIWVAALALPLLVSCGGGGDEPAAPETQVVDSTPPMTGAASFDKRRLREGWQPGYATEAAKIPVDKLGIVDDKERALAGGDGKPPLELGETARVAPELTSIPADAHIKGTWSNVYNWPLIPIHLSMLPDGRLVSYGTDAQGRQTAKTIYSIYDPAQGLANGHTIIPKTSLADIFCSASVFLSSTNQLLTIGGDNYDSASGYSINTANNSSNLFSPSTNTLTAANNMKLPRWYASATTLLDGTIFIQGGLSGEAYPEVRQSNGVFRALTTVNTSRLDYWYPHNWVLEDGRVFGYDSYGNYYYINTAGTGTISIAGQFNVNRFGEVGSAAMFAPGRVLQLAAYSNAASVIDFRGPSPILTPTQSMATSRQTVTATVLPNGKVLATGGSANYNELSSAVYTADTWDPATGGWTQGAAGTMARLYHSVGMLMPDGTVLVGGGGAWGPVNNLNVEFYYPSYLFNSSGLATRPIVSAAPTVTDIGATFKLTVSDPTSPITRVTMIRVGTITHGYNAEQNFNELTFTRSGNELTVQMPTKASDAPPGYYMVFTLSAAGVPSQARIVRVNAVGAQPQPNAPTSLTAAAGSSGNTLNWIQSTSANITSNVIERATSASGPFTIIATVTARTAYLDAITAPGTYYYRVSAVNSSGQTSVPSNVASVMVTAPPPAAPGAPTNLTGAVTSTGVNLSWTQGSGSVAQNIISRGTSSTGPFTAIATIAAATTYTDPNTTPGTYFYWVQASNSAGTSTASNVAQVTVPTTGSPAPNPPTGLSGYTCGSGCWTADTGIRFNWSLSSSSGVTQYVIRRSTAGINGPWTVVATQGVSTVYVDKNVTSGTTYWYSVSAVNSAGVTSTAAVLPYGVTSNITLNSPPPPPPSPSTGGGSISIESQGETQYLVMNWWRGDPAVEGNFRQPGSCTGVPPAGNCHLGARKTFRPMGFYIQNSMLWLEVPQFENGVKSFDHYALPVELIRTGCTFKVQHIRTHGPLEFPLNPPGLEILPHTFTMSQALCDSYSPTSTSWISSLNSALTAYLGPRVPYNPIAYPYNDPRTGKDPSQP